jgi:serine/threonine protein kinase
MEIELAKGTIVGQWRVHDPLGRGGQGAVWSVKPARTKRAPFRALKVCAAEEPQARARFEREVALLERCEGPHVLRVYSKDLSWAARVDGQPPFAYFVAEHCHGSLEDRAKALGDTRARLAWFRQACAAVGYLHMQEEPVIHRDIKPANFLITAELGTLVLADFGIARSLGPSSLTEAFEVVGTQYYRAPEVLHGQPGTTRSDVYGLGRLLEWLLTGEVSTDFGARRVPRGGDLDDAACDSLDRIILRATKVQAEERFASVHDLEAHLPELWLTAKPQPKSLPATLSRDPVKVLSLALELARDEDLVTWRQLVHRLRRDFAGEMLRWRQDREPLWHDGPKDAHFELGHSLLRIGVARALPTFAGVFAGKASLADAAPIIDDVLTLPDWPKGGKTIIVESPRFILFALHYLYGAICLHLGEVERALAFAEQPVPQLDRFGLRGEPRPLWQCSDLTGHPDVLGGKGKWAFEFMLGLWEEQQVLREFFGLKQDFVRGLASYSLMLSLLELATDAASPTPPNLASAGDAHFAVFPLFAGVDHDSLAAAARRSSGNRQLVASIASRTGAPITTMQRLWPDWKRLLLRYRQTLVDSWAHEMPLGELAILADASSAEVSRNKGG